MDGPVKILLIGWLAQWGIPHSLHGANMVSPGKKEQKDLTGSLRLFFGFSLTKNSDNCHLWLLFSTGKPSQCHSLTSNFAHMVS